MSLITLINLGVTCIAALCIALSALLEREFRIAADVFLFIAAWAYMLGTPILSAIVLFRGPRLGIMRRANAALLVLWVLAVVYTITLTTQV